MEARTDPFQEFSAKMQTAGVSQAAQRAFQHSYQRLLAGDSGMIPESQLQAVQQLPRLDQIDVDVTRPAELLKQAVIIKLNGGLGTSMGLERAKSLLPVKDGLTFLDFIVKQILHLQQTHGIPVRFFLMDSFSTSTDTMEFLKKYPELGSPKSIELMQSQVPKVDAKSLKPAIWPENPQLEWCPPGHGDIYPSLLSSGLLDRWLAEDRKYLFVSNADNLGASLDLRILSYFAASKKPFLMEVAERTPSDSKGGHLARRNGRLILRESAQCPKDDQALFQDITRHRFFNTNNLWIRLDSLKKLIQDNDGFVPLPLIKNQKTIDPRDANSTPVFQLETAMGAAIECFEEADGLVVPRSRFAPVKTTNDLLALRSDAYQVTDDWRITLSLAPGQPPPAIDLDPKHYKLVDQLSRLLAGGVPSLKDCQELTIRGPVSLSSGNVFRGKVSVTNSSSQVRPLPAGLYADTTTCVG
jgi:UDP-N-acetylglucosamine pyrophosphorylase